MKKQEKSRLFFVLKMASLSEARVNCRRTILFMG
jgi:hypothetical protein